MPRVVGIDPSLTKSGIGVVTQRADGSTLATGALLTHTRPAGKAKRAKLGLPETPTLPERRSAFASAAKDIARATAGASLAVIYDPPANAKVAGAARLDIPALWWAIVSALVRADVPVARVMDVSARKAITGSGKHEGREAVKVATALAVRKLWPDVAIDSDDVADALAAAHLGAVALGWRVETLVRHRDVKWSEWPEFGAQAEGVA
jgi:Holliday junction resolvasome RuvABC endonuclease subunit